MKRAAVILVLTFLNSAPFPATVHSASESIDSTSEKLESVEDRIGTTQKRIEKVQRQEKSILGSLETMDREISGIRTRVKTLRNEEKELSGKITHSEKRLREIRAGRDRAATRLSARSAALYKAGHVSYLSVVLNATSVEDLQRRSYYLKRLARHDADLFAQATGLFEQEREQMDELRTAKSRLVNARRDLEESLSNLSRKKKDRELLLAEVRDRKNRNTQLLRELETSATHLKDLLGALKREAETGESAFSTLKGSLKRPVSGRMVVSFGRNRNERLGTYTLSNGITMQSAEGTPIRSVYGGRVIFADWLRGYGRIIIIDHGGGYYTLYGHLSEFRSEVGEEVKADKVIGLVGDSGSLEGSALYFEIRHHGKPVDPAPWFSG